MPRETRHSKVESASLDVMQTLLVLLSLGLPGCAPYKWKVGPREYQCVEQGRIVRLIEVMVQSNHSPFDPRVHTLMELCSAPAHGYSQLPCWPRNQRPSDELLWQITWDLLPGHRYHSSLLHAASYAQRDIGSLREAWVVGTKPLVVAFLDPQPDLDHYRQLAGPQPASAPGIRTIRSHSGEMVVMDQRRRDAKLITAADLHAQANVVLLFPDDVDIKRDGFLSFNNPKSATVTQVLILRQPWTLQDLISALTKPGELPQMTEARFEVPLRRN